MRKAIGLLSLTVLFAMGCGGSSSGSPQSFTSTTGNPTTVDFEVIHGSQDAPLVNITVGQAAPATNVDFGESFFVTTTEGDIDVSVEGIIPGGNATVIAETASVTDGQRVTIIAANDVANIEPLILVDDQPAVDPAEVRVRVVHAASTAPLVDVYVTDPTTDITTVAPLGTFEFRGVLGPVTIAEGDYRIRVTPAGNNAVIAYDSGTVALAGGSDLVVTAITNTGPGGNLINLVATTGSAALDLKDTNTPADLRVVHVSPDAPDVDVIANDDFGAPAVEDLAFGAFTGFLSLPAGPINVKVVPANAATPVVIDTADTLSLDAGESYTVAAVGVLAEIEPLVLVGQARPVSTESRVRIVHGSTLAGDVDIYVVAPGTDISTVDPTFAAVPFKAETGFVSLAPADYDVVVTATGDTMPAIGPITITVEAGEIYTAIARDEVGVTTPLNLILLDDFI